LLIVVGLVHGIGMTRMPGPADDEGTYMAQAWAVQVKHALTPYTYWYDHPPVGWIQLAGWTWLTDGFRGSVMAINSGRALMLVDALADAALIFLIARRLRLSRAWASVAVLAFGLSPLAVNFTRMVYLDNLALPWVLAAFALALTPRHRLWTYGGSGACFALAVLSKETMLIFGPALVFQVVQRADRATRAFCVTAQVAVAGLLIAIYPLLAVLKGELLPGSGHVSLASAINFQLSGRQSTGNPFNVTSQAHALVAGWLHLDPWLLIAGALCVPVGLAVRRFRPLAIAQLIALLMVVHGGYLPVPFVICLLPFSALLIAVAGSLLQDWVRRKDRRVLGPAGILRMGAALGAVAAIVVGLAPAWATGLRSQMSTNAMEPTVHAEAFIEQHVPRHDHLLTDDTVWVDLVDHGFNQPLGVVWFYKLGYVNNLDPSVARRLPGGWRDFQFVVSTPSMRAALSDSPGQLPQVAAAIEHSVPVATFGTGPNQVQVRRVNVTPPPSTTQPKTPK
jgi:hypothetical protein